MQRDLNWHMRQARAAFRQSALGIALAATLLNACAPDEEAPPPETPIPQVQPPRELPTLYPTPKQVTARPDGVPITPRVGIVVGKQTDAAALRVVEQTLTQAGATSLVYAGEDQPTPAAPLVVWVGGPGENAASADALGALGLEGPAGMGTEGYVAAVGRGPDEQARVVLAGVDHPGTFYAAQTFAQLVVESAGQRWLAGAVVRDEPTAPYRGVIEGFYGDPWDHAARLDQLDFYGEHKLNTYVYAPKDDPYHRERWREPYPADKFAQLRELVQRAGMNHVEFVFSVSPGQDICYTNEQDFATLAAKMESIRGLGVSAFAILFDDIDPTLDCASDQERFGGDPSPSAAAQAYLLNRFISEFLATRPDSRPLITVPTEYSGMGSSIYRKRFAALVGDSVIVYWTGPDVVSPEISTQQAAVAYDIFKHDLLIWDNYPVNDFARDRLFLGPLERRNPAMLQQGVRGFTSNPMNQAESSKIPLGTIADFLWNPGAYTPERSWDISLRRFGGNAYEALLTFAENSRSSTLNDGESQELAARIGAFWSAYSSGDFTKEADALIAELTSMEQAPGVLSRELENERFLDEVRPWLEKLGLYGKAGAAAIDSLKAEARRDGVAAWEQRRVFEQAAAQAKSIPVTMGNGVVDPLLARVRATSRLVEIVRPQGTTFPAGADVELEAVVNAGQTPIAKVEFFAGPDKLGEDASAPYTLTWRSVKASVPVLTARATDTTGFSVTSQWTRIRVGEPAPVLFIVGGLPVSSGDAATRERLEFLGHPVETLAAAASTTADASGKAAVIVSSTVASGAVGTKFRDVAIPVATYESFLFDDMAMATSVGEEWNQSDVNTLTPMHPMAAGRSGSVKVYKVPDRLRWGVAGAGAEVVMTLPNAPERAVLFGYEQGATLINGSAAPARRAAWFLGDSGVETLTGDGLALFDASVRWLLGYMPEDLWAASPAKSR
jgi:hyaluronoglucosaminidase